MPWPPVPIYAELGELFLGDHVLSYGGALRFRVEEEGGEPLPQHVMSRFPLVSIHGNNIVLDYYEVSTILFIFIYRYFTLLN